MDYSVIEGFSSKELEQFKSVCNHLLGNTFVVRNIYQPSLGTALNNPEYTFLVRYQNTIRDYISLLDWELHQDEYHGYFYVLNTLESNRRTLNKVSTAILLALRLIYDEDSERAGLFQDVTCYVRDVLDKLVTVFSIFKQKPNMDEVKRSLKLLENHNIIQCIEGKYSDASCSFTILPTILTAVSTEKMNALIQEMKKEEADTNEEADEGFVD